MTSPLDLFLNHIGYIKKPLNPPEEKSAIIRDLKADNANLLRANQLLREEINNIIKEKTLELESLKKKLQEKDKKISPEPKREIAPKSRRSQARKEKLD